MLPVISYAQPTDDSGMTNLLMILGGAAILGATAIAVVIPITISRRRRHGRSDPLTVAALVWGLIAAVSVLYVGQAQLSWSREYNLRVESGYFDPQDKGDAPKFPWPLWTGLAVVYAAMLLDWSRLANRSNWLRPASLSLCLLALLVPVLTALFNKDIGHGRKIFYAYDAGRLEVIAGPFTWRFFHWRIFGRTSPLDQGVGSLVNIADPTLFHVFILLLFLGGASFLLSYRLRQNGDNKPLQRETGPHNSP